MNREVRRLLRTGPFEVALDAAIEASGLTLDRLCSRLADNGVTVSRTAISYWRNGRSRPERAESLAALSRLEQVLGLPTSSLVVLLGARRPRGRSAARPPGTLSRRALWPSCGPLLSGLDSSPDGQLELLSVGDALIVDEHTGERRQRTRLVVRATADRVDRHLVCHEVDDAAFPAPELVGVAHARRGRVRRDASTRSMVAEFLFDRPLGRGELTVVEYEVRLPDGLPLDHFYRRFPRPVGLYTLQLRFAGRPPGRVRRYDRTGLRGPEQHVEELWLSAAGTTALVAPAVRPGTVGVRWEW
ncbi:helix-turn-helix transcriptional regulator [Actinosynnema sp. NPDC047251]|uniref:PE-PGRS family protein n=1 Tax=Saccharothrix espanaensis (strain ATCC 51144 / DSM 44229 / JCM 9112 / NBRC 15066 / NRRL 15764) TaxID=1179773 RepID=K0JZZ4_SACES|nr:helix-turn-helix transcriptional regulator [Saccharothrix espanaensis]CCH30239.1 PE-PGRS family protein [Saccharothrix espanaensis DSM 44229]